MPESADLTYLRCYLDDPLTITDIGPTVTPSVGTETSEITYLRRYLDDPTS